MLLCLETNSSIYPQWLVGGSSLAEAKSRTPSACQWLRGYTTSTCTSQIHTSVTTYARTLLLICVCVCPFSVLWPNSPPPLHLRAQVRRFRDLTDRRSWKKKTLQSRDRWRGMVKGLSLSLSLEAEMEPSIILHGQVD